MVVINELRITPDGKCLVVEASIDTMDYYKDVYFDSVIIDDQDSYSVNGPHNDPYREFTGDLKHIRFTVSAGDLGKGSFDNDILFVYFSTKGTPSFSLDVPCGADSDTVMGVAYNERPLYNLGMNYIRELSDTCGVPRHFIDYILRYKAFCLCLKTGNYIKAIDYWKNGLFSHKESISKPKGCGCHGSYQ